MWIKAKLEFFHQKVREIIPYIFYTQCLYCESRCSALLCQGCFPEKITHSICSSCGTETFAKKEICGVTHHTQKSLRFIDLGSHYWYDKYAKVILNTIKKKQYDSLIKALVPSCSPQVQTKFWVCPVPSHHEVIRKRGFMTSYEIAKEMGYQNIRFFLKAHSNKTQQSEKKLTQRHQGIRGSFVLQTKSIKRPVLLIDDTVTTASTLNECTRLLKMAGAPQVYAWTLFRGKHS